MKYLLLIILLMLAASAALAETESQWLKRYKPDNPRLRILFLGNSFTYFNDMYIKVGELLQSETAQNARAGAYLNQHANFTGDELGITNTKLLRDEKWDYVVMQDQPHNPLVNKEDFLSACRPLCRLIHENGAKPVFYATWAYQKNSKKLYSVSPGYWEMFRGMCRAYHEAAVENHGLLANVAAEWYKIKDNAYLYNPADNYHPTEAGTQLASEIIARTILADLEKTRK